MIRMKKKSKARKQRQEITKSKPSHPFWKDSLDMMGPLPAMSKLSFFSTKSKIHEKLEIGMDIIIAMLEAALIKNEKITTKELN